MVRSVGGNACEPSQRSCLYDPDKPDKGLCDVCQIFGATGWARRFRLNLHDDTLTHIKPLAASTDAHGGLVFSLSNNHRALQDRGHKWYLSGNPLSGQVTLRIIPMYSTDAENFDPALIGALIQFIADRASIGAKPQMGLGVVQVVNRQNTQPLLDHLTQLVTKHQFHQDLQTSINNKLPCLQNMFFASINIGPAASESATFDLKYDLRNMLRDTFKGNHHLCHLLMGYVQGNQRIGSKIMMSYPDESGTIRMWGWIPGLAHAQISQDELLTEIYYHLVNTYGDDNIPFWLDFDPGKNTDILEYLDKKLLKRVE